MLDLYPTYIVVSAFLTVYWDTSKKEFQQQIWNEDYINTLQAQEKEDIYTCVPLAFSWLLLSGWSPNVFSNENAFIFLRLLKEYSKEYTWEKPAENDVRNIIDMRKKYFLHKNKTLTQNTSAEL